MSDMTIQIYNQNIENLTDLNVDAKQEKYYGLTHIRLQRKISQLAELYIAKNIGYPIKTFFLQNVKLPNQNLKTTNKPHHM